MNKFKSTFFYFFIDKMFKAKKSRQWKLCYKTKFPLKLSARSTIMWWIMSGSNIEVSEMLYLQFSSFTPVGMPGNDIIDTSSPQLTYDIQFNSVEPIS